MGRHLQNNDSDIELQGYHSGWMWGILHFFDHLHWQHAKKLPIRRKHGRGKHAPCFGNPKTVSFKHYCDEMQEYLDADAVPLLDEQQTTKLGKDHIKAMIAEEMSARSSDHLLGETNSNWGNPIIVLHKNSDTCSLDSKGYLKQSQISTMHAFSTEEHDKLRKPFIKKSLSDAKELNREVSCHQFKECVDILEVFKVNAKELNREVSCHQFKECVDILEVFKVNKKLFMEILRDPDVQFVENPYVQEIFRTKARLKRSVSFPAVNYSHIRSMKPVTLEDKQKEIVSFMKGKKLPTGSQAPKPATFASVDDSHEKLIVIKGDDSSHVASSQETNISPFAASQSLYKHRWHQPLVSQFRYIKKRIKHALKESKKGRKHSSKSAALLQEVSSDCRLLIDEKETSENLKEIPIQQQEAEKPTSSYEKDDPDSYLKKDGVPEMRRASSLHESLDRYAHLFEYSSTQEAMWHHCQSKSLRVTSEDKFPSGGNGMKSFTRRLSLSDLESICALPNEILNDTTNLLLPLRSAEDCHTNAESNSLEDLKLIRSPVDMKQTQALDIIEEVEIQSAIVERGNNSEGNEKSGCLVTSIDEETSTSDELHDRTIEQIPHQDQEISSKTLFKKDEQSLLIASEINYQDNMTGQTELPILQGTELGCSATDNHVSNPSVNLGTANAMVDGHFIDFGSNNQDDPDFSYVRVVLDISGFIEQGHIGKWHSLDQPLSLMLFKELEAFLHPKLHLSEDFSCNRNHRLLFDLVNELLLEIYGCSLAYFPKSFSLAQRARPLPKGNRIVEQVWKGISWYRNSRPESMDQSLDDIVGRDFEKGDAWMGLALDFEDVALEMEDLIFDQLLDEAVCL